MNNNKNTTNNLLHNVNILQIALLCIFLFWSNSGQCESSRFTKLDSSGVELPADAPEWAIVKDNTTGVYWEIKTKENSIHANKDLYKFSKANKNFIAELNKTSFGGFTDWRLPTTDELENLRQKGESEPFIDQDYFPNTEPESYMSWRLCGSGEITPEKIDFGRKKTKGRKRYVRAVRGTSPEGVDQL